MYHLLIIVVAIIAVVRGYRNGLTGQVTSVLGLAFGVICAHIFIPGLAPLFAQFVGDSAENDPGRYLAESSAAAAIYFTLYLLFKAITGIVRQAVDIVGKSLLDSIIGALFCLFNYTLMLSTLLNIGIGLNQSGSLMHDAQADDGNLVYLVVRLAPATLGSYSFADFAHESQLRDARKISLNFNTDKDVIYMSVI